LGISLGVTEIIYLLGFVALAAGIILLMGLGWALTVMGAILLATSIYNDHAMNTGKR